MPLQRVFPTGETTDSCYNAYEVSPHHSKPLPVRMTQAKVEKQPLQAKDMSWNPGDEGKLHQMKSNTDMKDTEFYFNARGFFLRTILTSACLVGRNGIFPQ